ncbi:MAG: carboxypeptidase-like regulatory domain-containing protein, partial [Dysgonamonadaceae bacterium]|nr:carboxypeptidase-like regulatory domain-containing protein [Dysgonamonadaceae bacterium]
MQKKIFVGIIGLSFLFAFSVKASVPVSGKVIEATSKKPLEYANVVLLSLPDSVFITGTVSGEDGLFLFDKVESGRYFIKISYLGLDDKFMPFEILTES